MTLARAISLALVTLTLTALSFVGCGVTPGRSIEVAFSAGLFSGTTFHTAAGWDVTLTEARIVLGPIYVLAPATRLAALERAWLPVARAHGGHDDYAALDVRAEWLDEVVIEAGAPVVLGPGHGIAGTAEYTSIELVMPRDASGPTHGHVAWVAGTATPTAGGETIAFEGGLDLPDEPLARSVESIASSFEMQTNGAFELMVMAAPGEPRQGPSWLEEAHFDRLSAPASGTLRTIAPGTQPYVAWMLAARDAASFTTRFDPAGTP